jgi:hypothetical protein
MNKCKCIYPISTKISFSFITYFHSHHHQLQAH